MPERSNEQRRKKRTYDGKIAADLPERPLRLSSIGLVTFAAAINRLSSRVRRIADNYDHVSKHEQAYAEEKISRGIEHVSQIWTSLKKGK